MKCFKPTLLNVYIYGDKKIIRRIHNKTYQELELFAETPGREKFIHLSKNEKIKYDIKYDKIRVLVEYSSIIPCGQCTNCLKERANKLTDRIILETMETDTLPYFICITYNNEHLPNPPLLNKEDAKKIIRDIKRDYPKMRYLLTGEYGTENGRPHYHILIWNVEGLEKDITPQIPRTEGTNYITYEAKNKYWKKGETTIARTKEPGTISYICKYAQKKRLRTKEEKEEWEKLNLVPEFQLMSKGIAYNYYENHKDEIIANHGQYVDTTHHTKIVDKSFIDWYKTKYGELDSITLYGEIKTTYAEFYDKKLLYEQRNKNALKNNNERRL